MKIKLIKFRDDLIKPVRSHYNDAGIDCFAQDDFDLYSAFKHKEIDITGREIVSNQAIMIPLGFGLDIPDGYEVTLRPRSSMNAKGIITQFGTIDSGYKGEIKAILINLTNGIYHFKRGDKICQLVMTPVVIADFVDELGEERGEGGFGSTDVKETK